jgi:hypothetical protein
MKQTEPRRLLSCDVSPETFLANVPTNLQDNMAFRERLNSLLAESQEAREAFKWLVLKKPQIAFKTLFWTFNPKNKSGQRHLPFITWDCQDEVIEQIHKAILTGEDLLIDKSRDMGATWLILGVFMVHWLFIPDSHFLAASRKEEFVDRRGDHKCLFEKLRYLYDRLPIWCQPGTDKTHMHLANLDNGSVIDGESTNANMGAGDRRKGVMVDEFARVNMLDAQWISENLSDTTDCVIYNSTHTTAGHPYAKLRYSGRVNVAILPWWKRPERTVGLYRSPDYGKVELHDLEYYQQTYPGMFDGWKAGEVHPVKDIEIAAILSGEKNVIFCADGKSNWRSTWYDRQCRRRSARDIATNLDMNPAGAGDMVFDPSDLVRMRSEHMRPAEYEGEILFKVKEFVEAFNPQGEDITKSDDITDIKFSRGFGKNRFRWWSPLFEDPDTKELYPDPGHSYIIGCDISLGAGQSNSIASVFDVNLDKKVGEYACSFTPPTQFADQVVAIAKWCGGNRKPFIIWESNGPGGVFNRRMWQLGWDDVYYRTDETKTFRPRTQSRGWHSSRDTKADLIYGYREALGYAFRGAAHGRRYINPCEQSITEAENYVFFTSGSIGPSEAEQEDSGGAKAVHGDRVIADALCHLARFEQAKSVVVAPVKISEQSYFHRRELYDKDSKLNADDARWQRT